MLPPRPKARKPIYNYTEVTEYLEKLHGKNFDDFEDPMWVDW